jgi:hypothetical protein
MRVLLRYPRLSGKPARVGSALWPTLIRRNTHQDARRAARRLRFKLHLSFSQPPHPKDHRGTAIPAALARVIHHRRPAQ